MNDTNFDLNNDETRSGFLVTTERKKLWAVELDLLKQIQIFCEENSIQYYAYGGTLLGCVRHSGFIPWDDDIDISMDRKNFIKFCKLGKKYFKYPYFLQDEESDPTSILGLAKLRNSETTMILKAHLGRRFMFNQGVFVDIFVQDNLPDDEDELKKFIENIKILNEKAHVFRNRFHCDENNCSILKKIAEALYNLFKIKNPYYLKLEKYCQKYNNSNTKRFADVFSKPERKDYTDKSCYEKTEYLKFENTTLPVPYNYKKVLTDMFGNWEKFEIGTSDHGDVIIDLNKSYIEYLNKN